MPDLGENSMALLKSYTCSKCGGVLVFDTDQEFFDCPFCGTHFDVVTFHGDEIFGQADACLERKEYSSAREKYKTILAGAPGDFRALKGIAFCDLKISDQKDMRNPDCLSKFDIPSGLNGMSFVQKNITDAGRDYFDKLYQLVKMQEEMRKLEEEKNECTSKEFKAKLDDARRRIEASKNREIIAIISVGLMSLYNSLSLIGSDAVDTGNSAAMLKILILFPIFLGGYAVIEHVARTKARKELVQWEQTGTTKAEELSKQLSELYGTYKNEYTKLKHLEPAEEDVPAKETEEKHETEDFAADADRVITCAKCGAQLNLDTAKRIYECRSCGVGYGVSLFFAHPLEKALTSMNMGLFSDAEERFRHILMMEPSDFDALLGMILCTGKWSRISEIEWNDELKPTLFRHINEKIKEASENSKEEDKQYFEKVGKLISALEDLSVNKHKQLVINNELNNHRKNVERYSGYDPAIKDRASFDENEINSRLSPFVKQEPTLQISFEAAKKRVLEIRSDSILAR